MKKNNKIFSILSLLLLFSSFLFLSCNGEAVPHGEATVVNLARSAPIPANEANIYDEVGKIHNEILYSYYSSTYVSQELEDVFVTVDSLAIANSHFQRLSTHGYTRPDLEKIAFILQHKITCASSVISNTALSVPAKTSLSNFISAVFAFSSSEEDYSIIYEFIVAYESDILHDFQLNSHDKEVLLTVSSIARYSVYAKKKRPKKNMDPDWDLLVSNIIASIDGASSGPGEALVYGLIAGIMENQ